MNARSSAATLIITLLAWASSAPGARANVITVNSTADPTSAGNCTLRDAIATANTNLPVASCALGSSGTDTIAFSLPLNSTITLGAGEIAITESVNINSPPDPQNVPQLTISGNHASRVFHVQGVKALITGIAFIDGMVTGSNVVPAEGGAILVDNGGTLTLKSCAFSGNQVSTSSFPKGGAVSANFSKLSISNTSFTGNSAISGAGGAVAVVSEDRAFISGVQNNDYCAFTSNQSDLGGAIYINAPATVSDCTFDLNDSNQGGAIHRAAIFTSFTGDALVRRSTFTDNTADFGGAILNDSASSFPMRVRKSTFVHNNGGPHGGAIMASGILFVTRSVFSGGNQAGQGGAIQSDGYTNIFDSTFDGNLGPAAAGAVFAGGFNATLRRNTFTNNDGGFGSGLALFADTALVANTTFSGNSSAVAGGQLYGAGGVVTIANCTITGSPNNYGIQAIIGPSDVYKIKNTIVSDNALGNCLNPLTTLGYNLEFPGNSCGFSTSANDIIGSDPLLDVLADNGGPTLTHALLSGSPAIDQGSPATSGPTTCMIFDQRVGTRPGGPTCDIGAYEVGITCPPVLLVPECSDGNLKSIDGCTNACTICGNGVVTFPEHCDDGNLIDGDGCSASCRALDDFVAYATRLTKGSPKFVRVAGIAVVDRYGNQSVSLTKPVALLEPASRQHQDPDASAHPDRLRDYVTKTSSSFVPVLGQQLSTPFGTLTVDVRKPAGLLVPTTDAFDPEVESYAPGVHAFACYQARATTPFTPVPRVALDDQLGESRLDVKKPTRLCVAADVNGQTPGAENDPLALLCFKVGRSKGTDKFTVQSALALTSMLGEETVDATKHRELCVASVLAP